MIRFITDIRKELMRLLKLKNLTIAVIAPVMAAIFFSLLYSNEIARDLPVGFYDLDRSELSRTILRYVDASNYMEIKKELTSLDMIESEIQNGNLEAVFVIPKNLEKDVKTGKPTTVAVYKNTANIVTGNMILKDATTVLRTVSAGALIKRLRAKGIDEEKAVDLANAINIESKPLFNVIYSYSFFLVPGLIFVTLQLAIMLSSVVTDEEPSEIRKSVFVRLVPQMLIQYFNLFLIMFLILPIFNIYLYSNFGTVFILFTLLMITSSGLSIFISSISKNDLFNTEVVLLLNTPAFLFCGLTYPLNLMPDLHNWFAQIIPFTHFLEGFLKTFYMNDPIKYASREINNLAFYSFGIIALTMLVNIFKSRTMEKAS